MWTDHLRAKIKCTIFFFFNCSFFYMYLLLFTLWHNFHNQCSSSETIKIWTNIQCVTQKHHNKWSKHDQYEYVIEYWGSNRINNRLKTITERYVQAHWTGRIWRRICLYMYVKSKTRESISIFHLKLFRNSKLSRSIQFHQLTNLEQKTCNFINVSKAIVRFRKRVEPVERNELNRWGSLLTRQKKKSDATITKSIW